ncbi:MAG: hypothetical protein HQ564_01050 [Candidatus Saganbacteria bacterium]|nr:hypothetical protein [Candidatus Saganbacteria bacterium]
MSTKQIYTKRNRDIAPQVVMLQGKIPAAQVEELTAFARGHRAMYGHRNILNAEGYRLQTEAKQLLDANVPLIGDIRDMTLLLPTIEEPRLELFVNPFEEEALLDPQFLAFKSAFNRRKARAVIQIASSCFCNCLHCGILETDETGEILINQRMRFMSLPTVLLLIKQLVDLNKPDIQLDDSLTRSLPNLTVLQLHFNSDVAQWRDQGFNADYGDLAKTLKGMGIILRNQFTHGVWLNDAYGVEALRKMGGMDLGTVISIHLFHQEIFPDPDGHPVEEWLNRYADRFAYAINALKRTSIRRFSDKDNPNQCLGPEYLNDFCLKRILPNIDNKRRFDYTHDFERVSYDGRAFENPYFPQAHLREHEQDYGHRRGYLSRSPIRVSTNGKLSVFSSSRYALGWQEPAFNNAKTVKEIFGKWDSALFHGFLRKLYFAFFVIWSCERDLTRQLWLKYFPDFNFDGLMQSFIDEKFRLTDQLCENIFEHINGLPVVSSELYYNYRVSDFNSEEFTKYLFNLFINKQEPWRFGLVDDYNFLVSFPEGAAAVAEIEEDEALMLAIKEDSCTEEQLKMTFELLKDFPVFRVTSPKISFGRRVLELKTETILPFRGNTGID